MNRDFNLQSRGGGMTTRTPPDNHHQQQAAEMGAVGGEEETTHPKIWEPQVGFRVGSPPPLMQWWPRPIRITQLTQAASTGSRDGTTEAYG